MFFAFPRRGLARKLRVDRNNDDEIRRQGKRAQTRLQKLMYRENGRRPNNSRRWDRRRPDVPEGLIGDFFLPITVDVHSWYGVVVPVTKTTSATNGHA